MTNFITQDFEPSSAAAWKQKIQFELDGADYNENLLTKTNEGITIKPFYHLDNFEKLNIPESNSDFKICQNITITTTNEANKKAIDATNNGANALKFSSTKPFNFNELFDCLLNKNIEFHLQLEFLNENFINKISTYLKNETIFFNIDILGKLAKTGNWYNSLDKDFKILENIISKNSENNILSVDVSLYQNAGANTVQQVAYALAHANEYLTKFGGKIANHIQFNFAIGSNYFFEISKIRAFRYLFNLVLKTYNIQVTPIIFAEPSFRNKTIYDFNVNILRSATECMSAILGGVNTISNFSYDHIFHNENEFGERIARNQLLILKEECNFKHTQFIPTNSYYIESITKQITEKALDIFKEIEASGGFLKHLKKGTIQRKIVENAKKEQQQFYKGDFVLLGTNKYPNKQDKMKGELQKNPFLKHNPKKTLIIPIIPKRLAEKLELKRLKDEA